MKGLMLCIGLFGTCGDSKWRSTFIKKYQEDGIEYFNPQVDDWKPELAQVEADHLANDRIILFPVTSETYGTGSLAETGFSILQAIRLDDRRHFVIMIEDELDEHLHENEQAAKESLRARALVKQHVNKLNFSNVHVVDNLDEMLQVSLILHEAEKKLAKLYLF
jgi:hypothetical protein